MGFITNIFSAWFKKDGVRYPKASIHPNPKMIQGDRFVVIDLETANEARSSICQVGITTFDSGRVVEKWVQLVNPQDYFDGYNIDIHGIDEDTVEDAPIINEIWPEIKKRIESAPCFSHTSFDRTAINQATEYYGLPEIKAEWMDSSRVARRVWSEVARRGYGLENMCRIIGYEFRTGENGYHDALEDAIGAGMVVLAAMAKTETNLDGIKALLKQRNISKPAAQVIREIGNDNNSKGPLAGHTVLFTGTLSVGRKEFTRIALETGCKVVAHISKKVTLLVVGEDASSGWSNKYKKATALIEKGHPISIIDESEFFKMAGK